MLLETNKIPFEPLKNPELLIKQKFPNSSKVAPQIFGADTADSATTEPVGRAERRSVNEIDGAAPKSHLGRTFIERMAKLDSEIKANKPAPAVKSNRVEFAVKSPERQLSSLSSEELSTSFTETSNTSINELMKKSPSPLRDETLLDMKTEKENDPTVAVTPALKLNPYAVKLEASLEPKYRKIQMTPSRLNFLQNMSDAVRSPMEKLTPRRPLLFPADENVIKTEHKQETREMMNDSVSFTPANGSTKAPKSKVTIKHISLKSKLPTAWAKNNG